MPPTQIPNNDIRAPTPCGIKPVWIPRVSTKSECFYLRLMDRGEETFVLNNRLEKDITHESAEKQGRSHPFTIITFNSMADNTDFAQTESEKIDLIKIFSLLWGRKKLYAYTSCIGILIGALIAFSIPKSYKAKVILAPEISGGGGMSDNISDLASMVGVNLNMNGSQVDAIYPELYPQIINSTPFLTGLFEIKVTAHDNSFSNISLFEYKRKHTKSPWWNFVPALIDRLFKKKADTISKLNLFKLTQDQEDAVNALKQDIQCMVDKKTSIITITVTTQDPIVSASVADVVQNNLQQYVTDYRTKKARNDFNYTLKLRAQAKAEYEKARQRYVSYADANEDVILQSFKAKQEELENEMQLKYNNYSQLSQQLQVARARIQERTPAFTQIQPASVPLKKNAPKRMTIILCFVMLAVVATSFYIVIKDNHNK
jgi:uncharacterized protein involved in exopolysaccharide biosynthesis